MFFSLKFQRSNRQNALAMYPAKGKTGEKGCMSTALWRGSNRYKEPFKNKISITHCDGIFVFIACSSFGMFPDGASRGEHDSSVKCFQT